MRITSQHGSMTAKNVLAMVKKHKEEQELAEKKKQETKEKRKGQEQAFMKCKSQCSCSKPNGKCEATGLKQCPCIRYMDVMDVRWTLK